MSIVKELDQLLEEEGVSSQDVDELLRWAQSEAQGLLKGAMADAELAPLLHDGGQPGPVPEFGTAERAPYTSSVERPDIPAPASDEVDVDVDVDDDEEDIEELDDFEVIDEDDLELIEDEQVAEPMPSFGPPDGNDQVPEWQAALYSAQSSDEIAAQRVNEESQQAESPSPTSGDDEPSQSVRLVAEEDDISQHSIDLSDLDGDPDEPEE